MSDIGNDTPVPDLTLHEVAELLRISYRRARQLRSENAFPNAYTLGTSNRSGWRVPAADLDNYRQAQRPTTPETDQGDDT